jgi:hypothetical protein
MDNTTNGTQNNTIKTDSPVTKEKNTSKTTIPYVLDDLNKEALKILQTKGDEEAIKFMFNPTGDRPLSYSEMRSRFG